MSTLVTRRIAAATTVFGLTAPVFAQIASAPSAVSTPAVSEGTISFPQREQTVRSSPQRETRNAKPIPVVPAIEPTAGRHDQPTDVDQHQGAPDQKDGTPTRDPTSAFVF
jgi:hypothetical protein